MADTEADLRRLARRRVKLKLGWFIHATVFVLVNLGLYVINRLTGDERWHLWPLFGWGLGLAIHGLVTWFALDGGGLRERMEAEELKRLRDGR
jgi:hypothetical protein